MRRREFISVAVGAAVVAALPAVPCTAMGRLAILKRPDGTWTQRTCASQDEAVAWLEQCWRRGDEIEIRWAIN